jgi:hypothetical protein
MKKKQNTWRNIAESIHKIYGAGMLVTAGFIVGFDSEKVSIANAMIEFKQAAIPRLHGRPALCLTKHAAHALSCARRSGHPNHDSGRRLYKHNGTCSQTFRKYYNRYLASGAAEDLLPKRRGPKRREISEAERDRAKESLFKILHSPPSELGFSRTTWKSTQLQQALRN